MKRDRLRRKAEITGRAADVRMWRKQAAIFRRNLLEAKRKTFDNFIENINYQKDSLKTYRFISNLSNKKVIPKREPIHHNNKELFSDLDIANAFAQSYCLLQRKGSHARKTSRILRKNLNHLAMPDVQDLTGSGDIFELPFTEEEFTCCLNKLKTKKSPGQDKIHAEFLKHLGKNAKTTLLRIFNCIWKTGIVPRDWKGAIIIPILKKGKDPRNTQSYRPISLTSIMAKLMERMVINRLNWFLESNNLLCSEQAGFRRNRSTADQVAHLGQMVKDTLDKRKVMTAVYIDFKSAYDSVWREKSILKLRDIGVKSNMLKWFKSFLDQRNCKVRHRDSTSKSYILQTGLPQGAVSSCSLFNVYINDLILALKSVGVECLLYADDLVIWTQVKKPNAKSEIERSLNRALEVLSEWCKENNMAVNIEKSSVQTFSLMHQNILPELVYRNDKLPNTDKFTYLGVTFDNKLSWKLQIESIVEKVEKRLHILKRLAGCLWGSARTTLENTFKTFILPVITYCCEVLITAPKGLIERLEILQNQALRLIVGAVKTTPIDSLLLLTNNRPIQEIIEERALMLYEKLIRIGVPFWKQYENGPRHLKTQCGFLQKALDLRKDLELDEGIIQEFLNPSNPLNRVETNINLSLTQPVLKSHFPPESLKILALETIHTLYPEPDWLHIYTDGSFTECSPYVGAGIYSSLFSFYVPVGQQKTAFDGEVLAICVALRQLANRQLYNNRVVLLSDSKAAIQAIGSTEVPASNDILECQLLLERLKAAGRHIVLQWIPGHCNIFGNEQADMLAKKGTQIVTQPTTSYSFHSMKLYIKNQKRLRWKSTLISRISLKSWGNLLEQNISEKPRDRAVAEFRLSVGHDCLAKHLHRIGVYDSPNCPLCKKDKIMDRSHLRECSALHGDSEVKRYWRARLLMRH